MTRQLATIVLTATLSGLFGGALLSAQDRSEVANIPFSFEAQGKVMPAGHYLIAEQNSSGEVYKLTSSTGQSAYWMATVEKKADADNPKLTFVKSGSEYVLASVGMGGSPVSHGVSDSKIQNSLSRSMGITSLSAVPLHAR